MGKYLAYATLVITILFLLEWFQIVDVPYFNIPDYLSGKKEMIESTEGVLKQVE
jgi:hypothetical protein